MNNSDVEKAVVCVNKIIDNVRCAACDRLEGSRIRYPCGNTACDDCVIYGEDCQFCFSPHQGSESEPKPDYPSTLRVKNATNLLKACQNLFDINAFQKKRISEQLRVEKELFPKCIQAPLKYENKRKSTSFSYKSKENRYSTYFPGEAISTPEENKMENSVSYVRQWLNKNENNLARKPFSDLNVNTQWVKSSIKPKNSMQNMGEGNISKGANRKRSHFKTTIKDYSHISGNRKIIYECDSTSKKVKKESYATHIESSSRDIQKCDNDESGIFMENDPIIIDDSQATVEDLQATVIDKDKNAWLAVLKACENENSESTSLVSSSQDDDANDTNILLNASDPFQIKETHVSKVPFYKKSAITETCRDCKNEVNSVESVPITSQSKPVKITIDGDNFLTTITISKNVQNNVGMQTRNNVSVQTDTCETGLLDDNICEVSRNVSDFKDCNKNKRCTERDLAEDISVCSSDECSEDLFADDRKIFLDICQKTEINKCIVIEESDSDTDLNVSGPMSVKADVHRSYQESEYGTLTEIVNVKEHETKLRRGPRGYTPTSTDSSEKENYNPNRMKRHADRKKKSTKK